MSGQRMGTRYLAQCGAQAALDTVSSHGIAHFLGNGKSETCRTRINGARKHLQNQRTGDEFSAFGSCREEFPAFFQRLDQN